MKIYETENKMFLSDTFVFGEIEGLGICFVKLNSLNQIEEIGTDIENRMHNTPIDEIICNGREASKLHVEIFRSIGDEYWWKVKRLEAKG